MTADQRLTRGRFIEAAEKIWAKLENKTPRELVKELMRDLKGRRIPSPIDEEIAARDARIRAAIDGKESYRDIAEREDVSIAHITRIGKTVP